MIKNNILEQIRNNPELQKDAEFMQKAIAIDESFIAYDKSEDTEVYLTYIYKKIDQLKKDEQRNEAVIECLENIGQEINNPKEVDKDKYKIPHKFLFERIKRYEKDGEPLSRYELRRKRINRIVLKLFTDCDRTVENKQLRETNLKSINIRTM